jgi:sugar lactone lactonase YvrE
VRFRAGFYAASALAVGVLAACAGNDGTTPAGQAAAALHRRTPSETTAKKQSPTQFLACFPVAGTCAGYDASFTMQWSFVASSGAPAGTSVGSVSGNWWVSGVPRSSVTEYAISATGATQLGTIGDGAANPDDVAVSEVQTKAGVATSVLISNYDGPSNSPGSALYIAPGGTQTTLLAPHHHGANGFGVALSKDGHDCYWSIIDTTASIGEVVKYGHCTGAGTVVASPLSIPGGVAVDGHGDLWAVDSQRAIYRCIHRACKPYFTGFSFAAFIKFSPDYATLYVSDAGNGTIDACTIVGRTCTVLTQFGGNSVDGIAVVPAAGN